MIFEILFLLVWISLEALLIWLILRNNAEGQPEPPPCYGHSVIVRSQRVGTAEEPNFYKKNVKSGRT